MPPAFTCLLVRRKTVTGLVIAAWHNRSRRTSSSFSSEIAALGARIDTARAEAEATVEVLRRQLHELEALRDASQWFSRFPRPGVIRGRHSKADAPLQTVVEFLAAPVIPAAPESVEVSGEGKDPRDEGSRS